MMTYAEAAAALGVKVDSVKRRARNRHWKRELGNDGLVRIAVPAAILATSLDSPPDNPQDAPRDDPGDILRLERMVSALETEVRMLRETQGDLRAERDVWRELAQRRWWHGLIQRWAPKGGQPVRPAPVSPEKTSSSSGSP